MTAEAQVLASGQAQSVPLSESFRRYVNNLTVQEVSLVEVVAALGDRSLPIALIIFSLPNCIPAPPGIGSIFALPVLAVAWQMLRGYQGLQLPGILARRKVSLRTLRWLADKGMRPLIAVERRCRPRLQSLVTPRAERWLSIWILGLACVVLFPGPMTNFLPAIAIVVMSVGLLERDGLIVLAGAIWGFFAATIAITFTVALIGGLWIGIQELLL